MFPLSHTYTNTPAKQCNQVFFGFCCCCCYCYYICMTNLTTFAFILFDVLHTLILLYRINRLPFFACCLLPACVVVVVLALIISVMPIYALTFRIYLHLRKKTRLDEIEWQENCSSSGGGDSGSIEIGIKFETSSLIRHKHAKTHVNFVIITINLLRWLLVSLFFLFFFSRFFSFFDFFEITKFNWICLSKLKTEPNTQQWK